MKHSILTSLVCPISGGELRLHSFKTEYIEIDGVKTLVTKDGLLISENEKVWYPISNYVPVLLCFSTTFHYRFYELNKEFFGPYSDYKMPYGTCEKGEDFIQSSFTEQWHLTTDSELTFQRTPNDLVNLNKDVWLSWIKQGQNMSRVLNVGCGIGKETMALHKVTNPTFMFAIDLNFELLSIGDRYKNVINVQFIICSLFHLPFKTESFDLVYSQGVIHHTYSTHDAFKSIASFVKPEGYLFIWVYALDDHLIHQNLARTSLHWFVRHVIYLSLFYMERLIRPWLSRSPSFVRKAVIFILGSLLHPILRWRAIHKQQWKLSNTRHGLSDLLTPLYAFRHNTNEVVEWFEQLSFKIIDIQSPSAHKKLFGKRIHGIGLTGKKADKIELKDLF